MRRLSLITLFIFCFFLLLACGKDKDTFISFSEAGQLAAQTGTTEAGTIRVPSPAGTKADQCIGWKAQGDNGVIFLPIGATYSYEAGEDRNFTPVYFHFKTHTVASAILNDNENGLCFTSTINKNEWDTLAAIAPSVVRGTLVLPTLQAQGLSALTHAVIEPIASELQVADIVANTWYEETSESLTYSAPFVTLKESDYSTNYTALGYIKITYTDGSVRYVYASYDEGGRPNISVYSFASAVQKFLSLSTNIGGVLDLTTKNGGICFTTTMPKTQWTALVSTSDMITRGTLIYPTKDLAEIGGVLTHASLAAADKTATDILSTTWIGDTNGDTLTFGATLTNIETYERMLTYTAVGYIQINHKDGGVTYIYASPEGDGTTSCTLRTLAAVALRDFSDTKSDYYKYPILGGFSPYTDAEREKLASLTKLPVMLVSDTSVKGNRRLDDNYRLLFNERIITDNDPACADEWRVIYQMLGDTIYSDGGALIITAADGEALTEENVESIKLNLGTRVNNVSTYLFIDGALIIPYKVYSRPY